jgi:hypothetical protein
VRTPHFRAVMWTEAGANGENNSQMSLVQMVCSDRDSEATRGAKEE